MTLPLGNIEQHFWLTRSVGRCLGVSFSEAMAEKRLSPDAFSRMVTRCRAADCALQCQHWISVQQTRAHAAPEFCANAGTINRLAGVHPEMSQS